MVFVVVFVVVVVFVAVFVVVVVFVAVLVVVVAAFAELDRADRAHGFVHRRPVSFGRLDDIGQPFFEVRSIHDEHCGVTDLGDLLSRSLEVVRVGADRHDRDDLDELADHLLDDIAEDVGGHGNGRRLARR